MKAVNVMKGYSAAYRKINNLVDQEKAVREATIGFMVDGIKQHCINFNLAVDDFHFIFLESVRRGGDDESGVRAIMEIVGQDAGADENETVIIGINNGLPLLVIAGDLCETSWDDLDNDTLRECFYEFKEAMGIALSNDDGECEQELLFTLTDL